MLDPPTALMSPKILGKLLIDKVAGLFRRKNSAA